MDSYNGEEISIIDVLKTPKSANQSYLNQLVFINIENTGASNNWLTMSIKYQACSCIYIYIYIY